MRLGARIIKSGVAVVLALYAAYIFELEPPVFAAIAAFLTVQPSLYRSWKHMLEQIQGNVIGAILAITGVLALGNSPVIIGLMVITVIVINLSLKLNNSIPLTILTVLAVMEVPEGDYLAFAINRFLLIMTGIMSSIIINVIFIPPRYDSRLLDQIKVTGDHMSLLLRRMTDQELEEKAYREEKEQLLNHLKKAEELFSLYQEERTYFKKFKFAKSRKLVVYKQMIRTLQKGVDMIRTLERHLYPSTPIQKDIVEDLRHHLSVITSYYEKVMMKFEGKIRINHPHEQAEEVFEGNRELLLELMQQYTPEFETSFDKDEKSQEKERRKPWLHLFLIIATLIEFANQLDYLDKIIENYHTYHREENGGEHRKKAEKI
ncbi:MAG: aromatic acid exporter family protein [Bacillaceae bacterium]|nr:aromatic acid exporter family protein [Bacillaceae bacterium]